MAKYPYQEICKFCTKTFLVKGASYGKTFCSPQCSTKSRQKHFAEKECRLCQAALKKGQFRFCSQSCAATFNNAKRTHNEQTKLKIKKKILQNHNIDYNDRVEKEKIPCIGCGGKKRYSEKYCSLECFRLHNPGMTAEQKKRANAESQSQYRQKQYRTFAPNANREKIREIYRNCPPGYEVDHIIPLSKGGLHHEDNLQYLTISENRKKSNKLL